MPLGIGNGVGVAAQGDQNSGLECFAIAAAADPTRLASHPMPPDVGRVNAGDQSNQSVSLGKAAMNDQQPPDTATTPGLETESRWNDATGAPGPVLQTASASFGVEFFESGKERIFGAKHSPKGASRAGVLVCSPLSKEWDTNHRREVMLGWELASRGFAVQRFNYRGCGESGGDPRSITFERMVEDAEAALARLTDTLDGDTRIIIQGTRLGAMVAATVAGRHPGAALALWQPITSGDDFFREVFRAQMIGDLKQGERGLSSKEVLKELEREGWVDVLGYPIGWELYQSTAHLSLFDLIRDARDGSLVQMSARNQVKGAYAKLAEHFETLGGQLEVNIVDDDEAWWFGARSGQRKLEIRAAALDAIPITVGFAAHVAMTGSTRNGETP